MACTALSNKAEWVARFAADAELAACVRLIMARIDVEIPQAQLELSVDLSAALQAQVDGLTAQLADIAAQLDCLNLIVAKLTVAGTAEAAALAALMSARATVLTELKADIVAQLAPTQLPAQVQQLKAVQDEMTCQRQNVDFFKGIL